MPPLRRHATETVTVASAVNPVPVMVTEVPPAKLPPFGAMVVTVGMAQVGDRDRRLTWRTCR